MARVKANLFDGDGENMVVSLEVDRDNGHRAGGWFQTDDGGIYVVMEVRAGEPPIEVELDAVWVDGPHPSTLPR